jgi:hypothetical protein
MSAYIIKSAICLFAFYSYYHIFLSRQKILLFNRSYLILSLVFSILIPFIEIPVKSPLLVTKSIDQFSLMTGQIFSGQISAVKSAPSFTLQTTLTAFYFLISFILFIRFAINIFRLVSKIVKSKKVKYQGISLVLINEECLPYSFLKYVFVNRSDFEECKIEKELLIHEEAHCLQFHSIDIIFVELLNVFLWFNPATWLYKRAILLNHEYYADNEVIAKNNLNDYEQLLLKIILRNNANFLVSNFKYSIIKFRLKMMTKSNPLHSAVLSKIAAVALLLIVGISLTFGQEIKNKDFEKNYKKAWWYPILKLHNMKARAFNTFDPVFEMGSTNSINGKIVTLENAVFLIKSDKDQYIIIKSPIAYHDLDKKTIRAENGTYEAYLFKSEYTNPSETMTFKNLNYQIIGNTFSADEAFMTINNKESK